MPRHCFAVVLLSALTYAATSDAAPILHNAELHSLGTPTPSLERAFDNLLESTEGPAWATYATRRIADAHTLCCGDPSICSLERGCNNFQRRDIAGDASQILRVMLRIENHQVTDIRAFSQDCHLDASGLPVFLWDEVDPRRSADFLIARAKAGNRHIAEHALMVVAQHEGGEIDDLLERIAHGNVLQRLEEEAIFWLGEARGQRGFETLVRLRKDLRDLDLREHLTFALHLNKAAGALPELIDMARHDPEPNIRGQALFWLSQQASDQAADAIAEASEEDPDIEVKERAVFALSQLPPDRGVPLLIHYAESHPRREIRKKAMFWLGQSEDSRALEFFEEILIR